MREKFFCLSALYYGLNALSNNLIMVDRKQCRSPNGLILGTPGGGKSMSCKREITFIIFDIKGLGKNLKKPGMLIVQDAVWNTVTINRAIGRSTWYFVDEFHLL